MDQHRPTAADEFVLRILVIEDNADGREMLRLMLELLGHEVAVAADGVEGVNMALDCHPDVAVVDIGLPRLDGFSVGRALRRELGLDVFLIAQTGFGQPEDRQHALASGFDVHLTKPVDPVDLIGWLETAGRVLAERRRQSAVAVKASAG